MPYDDALLAGGDRGAPIVDSAPDHPAAQALTELAATIASRKPTLLGQRLPLMT